MTTTKKRATVLAALLGATLALASCSSGDTPETTPAVSVTPAADATAAPAADATIVNVIEKEFTIELSETTFAPGTYTFSLANEGNTSHNLIVTGPGVEDAASETISGGDTSEVTVTLEAGTYELWCGVGNHKAQGMTVMITVA